MKLTPLFSEEKSAPCFQTTAGAKSPSYTPIETTEVAMCQTRVRTETTGHLPLRLLRAFWPAALRQIAHLASDADPPRTPTSPAPLLLLGLPILPLSGPLLHRKSPLWP